MAAMSVPTTAEEIAAIVCSRVFGIGLPLAALGSDLIAVNESGHC